MRRKCEEGCIPIVLISSYRFDHEKQPHQVVVTGFDANYVYLHDPNVDES
jgi:predicted double-glycine peptidase